MDNNQETEDVTNAPNTNLVQLTLNDIQLVVNVIDLCATRGAFQGNEMTQVGSLRDRLSLFVEQNTPATEEPTSQEEPTE